MNKSVGYNCQKCGYGYFAHDGAVAICPQCKAPYKKGAKYSKTTKVDPLFELIGITCNGTFVKIDSAIQKGVVKQANKLANSWTILQSNVALCIAPKINY